MRMLVSDFGDFDNDDALDTEPADPEQVAIRFHKYWNDEDSSHPRWDELSPVEKAIAIAIFVRLFAWLRRQGAFR
jgi:hypothetical protein